jgi:hypothetical protein
MKPLLLFACIILSFGAFSQSNVYKPFPLVDGATWKVKWQGEGCVVSGNPQTYSHHVRYQYTVQGDTIINADNYKKLYMGPVIGFPYLNCFPQLPFIGWNGYVGALRQDTAAKKVFFYPENDTLEYLLYDFGMQVGDTVIGYMNMTVGYAGPYVVSGFDSVLIGSEYHSTITVDGQSFIEGVGSSFGLLESTRYFEAGSQLVCFTLNGDNFVGLPYDCDMELTAIQENNTSSISVFPNPASTVFTVRVDNAQKLTIQLFNLTGQQVGSYSVVGNQLSIPRNNLPNGVYILQIVTETGIARHKLIMAD